MPSTPVNPPAEVSPDAAPPERDGFKVVQRLGVGFLVAALLLSVYGLVRTPSPDAPHLFSGVLVPETPLPRDDTALREVGVARLLAAMDTLLGQRRLTLDPAAPPPEQCADDGCRVLGLLSREVAEPLRSARERTAWSLRMRLALHAGQGLPGPLASFAEQNEALYLWAREGVTSPPQPSEAAVRQALLAREPDAAHALWVLVGALAALGVGAWVAGRPRTP